MNRDNFGKILPFNMTSASGGGKIIAVTSGKGGVGKTNISANIALTWAGEGYRVLAVDCDLGLANMDLILGVIPQFTLKDVLLNDLPVTEAITHTAMGVDLLPAAAGEEDLANLHPDKQLSFAQLLKGLRGMYDYIILDTGAGVHSNVTHIAALADYVLIVTTVEPTALSSAYAMIKILGNEKQPKTIGVVLNMASSGREGLSAWQALTSLTRRFLGTEPEYLGHIYQDSAVPKAVQKTYPLVKIYPRSPSARCIQATAAKIRSAVNKIKTQWTRTPGDSTTGSEVIRWS
ncbi:MinD/ParA family protein [Myxococcota bacterium]|nr:MinD/ParA family protein [Myxococcota bacterium]MBU1382570.1 MinD/ParA family protein [Myxococcota bacterium]MBU1498164.1 MinD/ParA family protein [Myxococcota bacterium]